MSRLSRRHFTAAPAGAAALTAASRVLGAGDRVQLGFIGCGNRGDQVLDAFLVHPDAQVAAVCDIWKPYTAFAARKAGGAAEYQDYRKLLERKDLDAVVICTPDHWHALQTIHACQAGRDVYVEKPLSLTVHEGRKMVEAARRYNRVVQVGLQRRSSAVVREAVDLVRSGAVGKITAVRAFHIQNEFPKGIGSPPHSDPPEGFDWEAWLGPAPYRPYNKNRAFYRFRWFYDYSGGQLTNFGVHYLDVIHWALGRNAPEAVTAMGGKFALDDYREAPDTLEVLWTYPGGTLVSFTQINTNAAPAGLNNGEIEFRGTKGTLYLQSRGYMIVPDRLTPNEFPARTPLDRSLERGYRTGSAAAIEAREARGDVKDSDHARSFLDAVKSRNPGPCDVEVGHRDTTAAIIGNIAHRTRTYLEWDAQKERFTNSDAANKLLSYEYRSPYRLPG